MGDKTTSEPKKPTTPTNTKVAKSQVALRTPTINYLGIKHVRFKLLVNSFYPQIVWRFGEDQI